VTLAAPVVQESQAEADRLQQQLSEERSLRAALSQDLQQLTQAKDTAAQVLLLQRPAALMFLL